MRMRSPRMAPPETGLDGSTAMMPTVLPQRAQVAMTALTSVDLPAPGGPVKPTTRARAQIRLHALAAGPGQRRTGARAR